MNKVIGIILYIIGTLFILAFMGQIFKFITAIMGVTQLLSDNTNSYNAGVIIGSIVYWILHITVVYLCFKYGRTYYKKG